MPRSRVTDPNSLDVLLAVGDGAPTLEQKLEHALALSREAADAGRYLLHFLIDHVQRGRLALNEARSTQEKLRALVELVDQPPWHPAIFLRGVPGAELPRALVIHAGQQRVVGYDQGVDPAAIRSGDEVYLSKDLHLIMAKSPYGVPACGETAYFERYAGPSRCVIRYRDEEVIADMADQLATVALQPGDQLRWERSAWMAFEKIERAAGQQYFLDDVEQVDAEQIGGQSQALETVLSVLTGILIEPDLAHRYRQSGCQSILMEGPPGCGKTLMAKAAASMVRQLSGKRCRFAVVKPGEWLSMWVGDTENRIRSAFKALREAAHDPYAILFLDEVESIGRIRGGSVGHHGDTALACLLAELNGFKNRGNVAIIAATNRKDLVDPALLERLSDVEVSVRRPDRDGARIIFGIHLPEELPFAVARRELIEAAVARFYSPNAETELCTVRFRDGTSRTVAARELASGRLIAQMCHATCRRAFDRHMRTGEEGIRREDIHDAVAETLLRLSTTLTRHNAHNYLNDLPQDVDILAVEPIVRSVRRPHRYLEAA